MQNLEPNGVKRESGAKFGHAGSALHTDAGKLMYVIKSNSYLLCITLLISILENLHNTHHRCQVDALVFMFNNNKQ